MSNNREKPILFNTPMVRAIQNNIKTETRRIIKPQPIMPLVYISAGFKSSDVGKWKYPDENVWEYWGEQYKRPDNFKKEDEGRFWKSPYNADDILYVRETWAPLYKDETSDEIVGYMYKEQTIKEYDSVYPNGKDYYWPGKWKPSIHMPKEAARIWLKVNTVQVEQLQNITEECIAKEGLKSKAGFCEVWNSTVPYPYRKCYGWDANPWVWVVRFERIERKSQ